MDLKSLSNELYREYEFGGPGGRLVYRITDPKSLAVGTTTHRVVDAKGIVHCVPAPGFHGCVIRWQARHAAALIQF
jgi:hypothetical protein